MATGISDAELRAPVVKMVLYMMRMISDHYLQTDRFGAVADDLLLGCAIFVGQAEGRPMPVSKLADYAGVARPTATRKLAKMHAIGVLERNAAGRYLLPLSLINSVEALAASRNIRRRLTVTAATVSSLDSPAVADNEA